MNGYDDTKLALGLAAGGAAGVLLGWIFGWRLFRIAGWIAAAVGLGLFAKGKFEDRQERVDAATASIRSELDDLDPVARAQVLADVALQ